MATIYAIRGLLLEEVLLNLLRESGYSTVEDSDNDITLQSGHSGLEVRGRGSQHQIDAIANFSISPPFSYPIRILLEAKFYSAVIGIDVIRNAVGVLKDVNEFFIPENNKISKPRYHYQYAIFTSSSFAKPAQEYAFAHDIYLIKLENNRYFSPIISAIANLDHNDFDGLTDHKIHITLKDLRKNIRHSLKESSYAPISGYCLQNRFNSEKLCNLVQVNLDLGKSYLGVLSNGFPIFFTPSPDLNIEDLISNPKVRIYWDDNKWYIVKSNSRYENVNVNPIDILFSFDLPKDLFNFYADNNNLSQGRAYELKQEIMHTIQIFFRDRSTSIVACLELKIDQNWLQYMKDHL